MNFYEYHDANGNPRLIDLDSIAAVFGDAENPDRVGIQFKGSNERVGISLNYELLKSLLYNAEGQVDETKDFI